MLAQLRAAGLSPRTAQYARDIRRSALGVATKRWRLIDVNVAALADAPGDRRPAIVPLSTEQAAALLRAAGDRWEALYVVALSLGVRQGEALGLRLQDVDLERRELRVRSRLQRVAGTLELALLKTEQSRRDMALPKRAVAALHSHAAQQREARLLAGSEWEDRGLVFCTGQGRPLAARNVVRAFKALLARAGLPATIRFYDLRHSCATFLRAQGEDLALTSRVLGHSQIGVTVNTYTHVLAPAFRAAADRMDVALGE
jgi:integrase